MHSIWHYVINGLAIFCVLSWLLSGYTLFVEREWERWKRHLRRFFTIVQLVSLVTWGVLVGLGLNKFMIFISDAPVVDEYGELGMSLRALVSIFLGIGASVLWAYAYSVIRKSNIQRYRNEVAAVKQLRKDAKHGNAEAQFNLGAAHWRGEWVRMNSGKAVKWFKKAAEQGHAAAQYCLGLAYDLGKGVRKDSVKAVEWHKKAAEQGHTNAQLCLGEAYSAGVGVRKDLSKAAEWYKKAAERGESKSQMAIGRMYATGEVMPKDMVLACAWFNIAAAQFNMYKDHALHFENELSPEDRFEARALASNWKLGNQLKRTEH